MFKHILRWWLFRAFRRPIQKRRWSAVRAPASRLGMELLEDRITPTLYTVNSLVDTGTGSGSSGDLLYCITQANNNGASSSNSIVFGVSGTITLTSLLPALDNNLAISAPADTTVTVNGAHLGSVFTIDSGETVSISGLTITDGSGSAVTGADGDSGGGILNDGTLTVSNSTITGNTITGVGGGILNLGTMTIDDSTVSNNTSGSDGGGIYSQGTLTIVDSTLSSNIANSSSRGGAIYNGSGSLTVDNSVLSNNSAGYGGGVFINAGTFSLADSTLSGNSTPNYGGGICNLGTTTIGSSTISNNSSTTANGAGGGIFNQSATLTVFDSTFTGNSSAGGGGIFNLLVPPASTSPVALVNCTISGNTAYGSGSVGGGIEEYPTAGYQGEITLENTIVAGNSATEGAADPDFAGPVNSSVSIGGVTYAEGYNLIGNGAGSTGFANGVNGDLVGTSANPINPELGPLQNNGGPTQTMALLSTSPAIDSGNPNAPGLSAFDQRGPGFPRLIGGLVDIGAYESTNPPSQLVFANAPSTVTAGQDFDFQVDIEDIDGNLVTTDSSTVTATLTGPGSFTSGSTSVVVSDGIASFNGMSIQSGGSYTLQISDAADGLGPISADLTIVAGSPAILSVSSGSGQSVAVSGSYAPLVVELTDAYGNPIDNATVKFTAPGSGASVTLGGSPATTNASGLATVTAEANSTAGVFTVTATDGSLSTSFQLTNKAASASKLVFLGTPPTSATAGDPLSNFQVAIEDSDGNVVASDSSVVTISLSSGSLTGTTSVSAVNGIASFSGLITQLAGANSLDANDSTDRLTQISTPISINAGSPAILSVNSGSGQSAAVGNAYASLVVKLTDAYGNPISGATVAFTAPNSGASATLGSNLATNAGGLSSVSAMANSTAGAFDVTATAGSLSTSFLLTNNPGPASRLVFLNTPPSSNTATAGEALSNFQVAIEDGDGNVVTGDSSTVAISLSSGSLTGTTSVSAVNGIASFSGLTTQLAGANNLQANDSTDELTQVSTPISIDAGSPAILSVSSGSGQNAPVGSPFVADLVVELTDAYDNPIEGANVTFSAPASGASASLGASTPTNSSGQSSINVTAKDTAGSYLVTASVNGLSTSFQLANDPGPASKLVFLGSPPVTAEAGEPMSNFQVAIEDGFGNAIASDSNNVTVSMSSGSLNGTTSVSAVDGIASFSGLTTLVAGGYSLQASDGGDDLTSENTAISVVANTPAILSVSSGSGQSASVGSSYAPLTVELTDAYGNPVSGVTVAFTAPTSGASVTLGSNPSTNAGGLATVAAQANSMVGVFDVTATAGTLTTSFQLTNEPGPAGKLVFLDPPLATNTTTAGDALPGFEVAIEDSDGNVVTSDSSTVTVSLSSGTLTGATSVSAFDGIASFSGLTTQLAGSNNLQAGDSTDELTQVSTPIGIDAGSPAILNVSSGSGQSASVGGTYAPLTVELTDAYGNPIGDASVTFAAPGSGASVTLGSDSATTNSSGLATVTAMANSTVGVFDVTATVGTLTTSFQLTNEPGTASQLVYIDTPPSANTATAGEALSNFQVAIEDADGNVVASDTSAVTISLGSGLLTGTTTINAVDGVASFTGLSTETVGGNNLSASDSTDDLTSISTPITIDPPPVGNPALLTVSGGSGQNAAVGTAYATALQVTLTDAFGKPIEGESVTFSMPDGFGIIAGGATFITNSEGIATAGNLTAGPMDGSFVVTATCGTLSASFELTNTAGAPANIVVSGGESQNTLPGAAFGSPLQALVTDAYGNPEVGVAVVFTAPVNGPSGTFSASSESAAGVTDTTVLTNSQGIATAPAATANNLQGDFTVTASTAGVSGNASFDMTVTGIPTSIAVSSGSKQTTTVDTSFANPLQVVVLGKGKKPIAGITVVFEATGTGASGVFVGPVDVVTNASGIATAPELLAGTTAGKFDVEATVAGVAKPATFTLTSKAAAAASVSAESGSFQSAAAGKSYAKPLEALVVDRFGNPVGGVTVTFSVTGTGASGTFANKNSVTAVTNAEGIAKAPALKANSETGSFMVSAVAAGASTTFSLANVSTAASKATASAGTPQTSTVGQAFGTPLQVTVTTSKGQPVSGAWVIFSAPSTGASGLFDGENSIGVLTNSSGIAIAPTLTANTVAGNFSVSATLSGVAGSISFSLTNQPGAAAAVSVTAGNNQSAGPGNAFLVPLVAIVTDAFGNVIANAPVTFTVEPNAGAGGTFSGNVSTMTVDTNAQGVAIAPVLTANDTSGDFTVEASLAGVTPDAVFTLTNL